jgi:hypothetical protein
MNKIWKVRSLPVFMSALVIVALGFPLFSQNVYQGIATHFDGLGSPYGGCGVPQNLLETQNFLALNAFNTPGNYAGYSRPVTGADTAILGEFANGSNCGRWAEVTIGSYCTGTNDGAQNQPFCRGTGANWVDDQYSGAVLDLIVADCCPDPNAWCRDNRYHLDLVTSSLNTFVKNGAAVGAMNPDHWNNREITWHYIPAPNYTGDVRIFFMKGSQQYWAAILITRLKNGIHGVQQKVGTTWSTAQRNSDMGQSFILPNTSSTTYTIRIIDASNTAINNSREYTFSLPSSCGGTCSDPATEVTYTTFDPGAGISAGILTKAKHIRFDCSKGTLIWQAPRNSRVEVAVMDILGRTVYRENPVAGQGGSGIINMTGIRSGIFIGELRVNGAAEGKLVFAQP